MNHRRLHDAIIANARRRRKPRCYYEKHHVVPKSLKGSDKPANIVALTYREHFLIHWLLTKLLTRGRGRYAMLRAFHQMSLNTNGRRAVSSWRVEMARRVCAQRTLTKLTPSEPPSSGAAIKRPYVSPDIIIKGRHYKIIVPR